VEHETVDETGDLTEDSKDDESDHPVVEGESYERHVGSGHGDCRRQMAMGSVWERRSLNRRTKELVSELFGDRSRRGMEQQESSWTMPCINLQLDSPEAIPTEWDMDCFPIAEGSSRLSMQTEYYLWHGVDESLDRDGLRGFAAASHQPPPAFSPSLAQLLADRLGLRGLGSSQPWLHHHPRTPRPVCPTRPDTQPMQMSAISLPRRPRYSGGLRAKPGN
jgi:hypothetical protein